MKTLSLLSLLLMVNAVALPVSTQIPVRAQGKIQDKSKVEAPAQPQAPAQVQATPPPPADSPLEAILNEDLIRALRDPFQLPTSVHQRKEAPKSDLEAYALKDFKLNGVITGPKKVRAMLTGPSSKTFFVKVGDRIGVRGGKITHIASDSVRITEFFQDEQGRDQPDVYEIRIGGELVSLTKKEEGAQ